MFSLLWMEKKLPLIRLSLPPPGQSQVMKKKAIRAVRFDLSYQTCRDQRTVIGGLMNANSCMLSSMELERNGPEMESEMECRNMVQEWTSVDAFTLRSRDFSVIMLPDNSGREWQELLEKKVREKGLMLKHEEPWEAGGLMIKRPICSFLRIRTFPAHQVN